MTQPTRQTRPEAPTAEAPSEEKVKVVKYTGPAGTREISGADWKAAGIEGHAKITWNEENEYTVPQSEFSEAALELLKRDRDLKIS